MELFRYMRGHGIALGIVIVLMIVQVCFELLIPRFTADLVDIGIRRHGIPDGVPEIMRVETYNTICSMLSDEDASCLAEAYEVEASVATLDAAWDTPQQRQDLLLILDEPVQSILSSSRIAPDTPYEPVLSGTDGGPYADGDAEDCLALADVAFVAQEYEALGLDLAHIRTTYLLTTGACMLLFAVLSFGLALGISAIIARTSAGIACELRQKFFAKVLTFSDDEVASFGPASLITRCTNDIQQVQSAASMIQRMFIYSPLMGIGAAIMIAQTAPDLWWIVAAAVALMIGVVIVAMCLNIPRYRRMQTYVDDLNRTSREILTGVPVIRAFCREKHEEQRFDQVSSRIASTACAAERTMAVMRPSTSLIMNAAIVLIVWAGSSLIEHASIEVGDLIAFINYATQVCMSLMMLALASSMLPRAQVAAVRIDEVLTVDPRIQDPVVAHQMPQDCWKGNITFEHVSLSFGDESCDVLHDISFEAKPGTTTAIVGATGSGKSSLLKLIPRLYDPSQGCIRLDGIDIRTIDQKTLRACIGYVPQQPMLFTGTLRSNVSYAQPSMPNEQILSALQVAQAQNMVDATSEGIDAPVARAGGNLSGGQKQRLAIARALAAKPLVYLFDDALSALDTVTDARLREALAKKTEQATVLIVAQRVSTTATADQVVVLDDGEIVGIGTHAELLTSCPTYREIVQGQLAQSTVVDAVSGELNEQ